MTNNKIAEQISDIGDMLEILDREEDQFRIIAYHTAARKIEMLSYELEDLYKSEGIKGFKKVGSIGETISKYIEELIKTGKIKYREHLIHQVPKAIIEFTKIPGIGPKTALKLFESYKIDTIKELKVKLKSDKSEKFFKEKSKQNVLEGIDLLSHLTGRMLLSFAEPIAQEAVDFVKKNDEIISADFVGSLRRMKETVGDIDIVASLKLKNQNSNVKIIESFIQAPFVDKVISHGDTKATIVHKKGVQIDLEIVPEEEYGSLLQHFTGSKEHNVKLRTWAQEHKFSISEHGIKRFNNKSQDTRNPSSILGASKIQTNSEFQIIKCSNEEKVYKTLGMDYIPPELREDRGEIEAALNHKLPKLVELKDIKGDFHIHSTWSEGEESVETMAKECLKLGYTHMAVTDHTAGLGITHGLKEKDFEKYINEIKKINDKFQNSNVKFKILSGAETNIMANGNIDISDQYLAKLDFVIASIHSGFRQAEEQITNRILKTIQNPNVDVIGHPSGRLLERRHALNIDWQKVFKAAAENNVEMEINAQPDRLDLNDSLILMAKDYGVKFIISTDSHHIEHLQNMRYGVAMARRGWLEKKDVLNTYSIRDFEDSLSK